MAIGTWTLTGKFLNRDQVPASGVVQIDGIPQVLLDTAGNKVHAGPKRVVLDTAGAFTIALVTDSATGVTSSTCGYRVTVKLNHQSIPAVEFWAPGAGATLDMADVTPQVVDPTYPSSEAAADALAAAAEAEAFAELAEDSAVAAAASAAGATGATDAGVTALIEDDTSDVSVALSATYVPQVNAAPATPLIIPTYDDDPNTGHPSVVEVPGGLGGFRYWMAHTPYPAADRENPSILASHNGVDWVTPNGLADPLVTHAAIIALGYNYGSDTHLIHDGTKLVLFYRIAHNAPTKNAIYRTTSTNGVTWTAPAAVIVDAAAEVSLNSPAVVKEADGTYTMWVADSTTTPATIPRRTSADGITWAAPSACVLPVGTKAWHLDVQLVGATYHMLVNSNERKQGHLLYYLTSTDGITWAGDVQVPAVEVNGGTFAADRHYRAAMIPRLGTSGLWDVYTTLIKDGPPEVWRIGLVPNTPLPTLTQQAVRRQLERDRTDALHALHRWVVGDSFARADGAIGTANTGQVWTSLSGTATVTSRVATAAATYRGYIESGLADCEVAVDYNTVGDGYLLLRATDDSNWLRVGTDGTSGRIVVEKRVAGTITQPIPITTGMSLRNRDRLRVRMSGSTFSIYRNADWITTFTDAHNSTATKHGLAIGGAAGAKFKAFATGLLT